VPNIRFAHRPEERIANRVHEDIRIGMPIQPFGMGDFDPSQHQFAAFHKPVNIIPDSDVVHGPEYISRRTMDQQIQAAAQDPR
jgi:hypothetical protein